MHVQMKRVCRSCTKRSEDEATVARPPNNGAHEGQDNFGRASRSGMEDSGRRSRCQPDPTLSTGKRRGTIKVGEVWEFLLQILRYTTRRTKCRASNEGCRDGANKFLWVLSVEPGKNHIKRGSNISTKPDTDQVANNVLDKPRKRCTKRQDSWNRCSQCSRRNMLIKITPTTWTLLLVTMQRARQPSLELVFVRTGFCFQSEERTVNGGKTIQTRKNKNKYVMNGRKGLGSTGTKQGRLGGVSGTSVSRPLRSCLCCCIPFEQ